YIGLVDANAHELSIKSPLWNSPWEKVEQSISSKVAITQMSNGLYRITVLHQDGSVFMKEGSWNSDWIGTIETSGVSKVVLAGNRLCAIRVTGGGYDPFVDCKEGNFGATPRMTSTSVTDFLVNSTRFLSLHPNGSAEVMLGTLTNNSGWQAITDKATEIELN